MSDTTENDQLQRLEARMAVLEDRDEILRLLARYGPSADSGSAEVAGGLFTDDALYDTGVGVFEGAQAVHDMIQGLPLHLDLMRAGCAHTLDLPVIDVQGDRATAFGHGFLLRREGDAFVVWRATAVHWDFERVGERWRIAKRVNRLLDGSEAARMLFREDLHATPAQRGT